MSVGGDGVPAFAQCAPFDLNVWLRLRWVVAEPHDSHFCKNTPVMDRTLGEEFGNTTPIVETFLRLSRRNKGASRTLPNSSPPAPRLSFPSTAVVEWSGQGSLLLYSYGCS